MYKTKKEVDTHVRNALSKLHSELERNLRSFTVAKLYYKINEFASAEQYLCSYLSVKKDNDQALKLLGQCYQRLKKPDKALQSFQRSLQLNTKQPDVLVEVCQLLIENKNYNVNEAKHWCELAESEKVQHDAVFSLRLKLMNKDNLETNQVEELIQKEISARPNDVQLRVRLVRNYIEQNKVLDAFKYVHNLEMTHNDNFNNSSEWYNIVWLVLSKYEQMPSTKKDWNFWLLLTICLERQVYISFASTCGSNIGGVTETANLLFNLDQYLYKISQLSDKFCTQKELVELFLEHYRGQLLLHSTALILKRELLQNKNKWKETVKSVLPLLLLAFQIEAPDNKEPWMKHCDESGKQLIQLWNREGAFRCAQVGRTLLSCITNSTTDKENASVQLSNMLGGNQLTLWNNFTELLAQIRQTCADKQWRRNVFALLFCNSDQKVKEQSSLLIKSTKLAEPLYELPTYADVERYEEMAQYLKPQSLQHMVYLCLANDNLAYVRTKYFSGLNFSTQNLAFCGAESLNQLDVDTFLYAATLQAKRMLEVDRDAFDNYNSGNRNAAGKPRILPFVNIQGQLCSEEQANWWTAAYQVYKNLTGSENLAELRANLQFGIEAVRGINGPKIDMIIVFQLGQIFVARAQDIVKPVEKGFLEARAENIYKYGLSMLKLNNKGVLEPFRKYFKYAKANTSAVEREIAAAAEDAVTYLATRYFKKAEYEELIDELAGVQLPFATYLQAEAYRKLDEANKTPKKAKRMYLDRASECLNQTLSLLKNTQTDPNHPLNSVIHGELKRLQQASTKFTHDALHYNGGGSASGSGALHNNSSTYEDAEDEFYADASPSMLATIGAGVGNFSRTRRELNAAALIASPRNTELENLVKQMANTLTFVKEEIVDTIKPEVVSMRKEISSLKEKIAHLEDAMKKSRISSNPPSRDEDASHVLDDLYMIEDALQNQMYTQQTPQTHMSNANIYPQQQQQQRIHTPTAMQMQHAAAAAAAYNSPMFNPNYPMNYYTPPPYMMPQQTGAPAAAAGNAMLAPRNALPMPYMETGGLNFGLPPQTTTLLPQTNQDIRNSNLYGLLTQQPQAPAQVPVTISAPVPIPAALPTQMQTSQNVIPSQLPQIVMPLSIAPLTATQPAALISNALGAVATTTTPIATTIVTPAVQFNKTLNNQPVEKGPPANVVITSSDPLPNPFSASLQTQQPTLSVIIPSHHIKSNVVQATETNVSTTTVTQTNTSSFVGSGAFSLTTTATTASPFASFGSSNNALTPVSPATGSSVFASANNSKTNVPSSITAVNTATFSFKPQIEQAKQTQANAEAEALNRTSESNSSDVNRSTEAEIEYDPRPDFKPIIPLPDEIVVRTGEEDEQVMFCYRAKLYRHADKEWKERGIGDIKILKGSDGSSRLLMRRDQTHKICANHKITSELTLTIPKNEKKGFIWYANDFADEELRMENFFVRFKLPETAQQFHDAFKQAQKEAETVEKQGNAKTAQTKVAAPFAFALAKSSATNFATSTPATKSETVAQPTNSNVVTSTPAVANTTASKTLFSGMNLSTNSNKTTTVETTQPSGPSPFANFTFDKSNTAAATNTSSSTAATTTASPFANIFGNLGKSTQSPFSTTNLSNFQTPLVTSTATTTDGGFVNIFSNLGKSAPSTFNTTNSANLQTPLLATTATPSSVPADNALNKSNVSDNEDEYVPTAQFNPVIPLPDLIEVNTGEENEILLFEHRAKLLRFDKEASEWKERGLGNIKLLQDANDVNKVRLVMRREQIHKLCCNLRVYKDTHFKYAKNSKTALSWAGQDYSENELVTEMLTVRFKTADVCAQFLEALVKAQANMTSAAEESNNKDNKTQKEPEKNTKESSKGFGDAFKPKVGSWNCEACYITNGADKLYCVACDSPKDNTVPKKGSISVPSAAATTTVKNTFSFGFGPTTMPTTATATATATNGTPATTAALSATNTRSTFTFGMPAAVAATSTTTTNSTSNATTTAAAVVAPAKPNGTGFGDQFKPKVGSWSCQDCYLNNTADVVYCKACDSPKDASIPKKEAANNVLNLSNPSQKFNFGFAAAGAATTSATTNVLKPNTTSFTFGIAPAADSTKPIFGSTAATAATSTTTSDSSAAKSFTFAPPTDTSTTLSASLAKPTFSFTLPSKALEAPAMPTAAAAASDEINTAPFSLDKKDFSFTLKPKSPGKVGKSPLKFGGGGDADGGAEDADDGDYHEEEENNTYFTPVIPLPDKIEVKTGEEDEDLLYVHRAKLYRFCESEWKERGVGDVKILRHKQTRKLRIVMRRDPVFKICLNHALTNEVEYKHKDDKSWLFVVNDFSEGAIELVQFSLRFKTKEIAEEFMQGIKRALAGTAVVIASADSTTSNVTTLTTVTTPSTVSSSATAMSASNISADNKKLADQLKLPHEFFTAQPTCAGCRGCDPDKFIFPVIKHTENFVHAEDLKNALQPLEMPALTLPKADNRSFLKQSTLLTNTSAAGIDVAAADTAKVSENLFSGFGGAKSNTFAAAADKTANTAFSFTAALNSTNKPEEAKTGSGGFLFGSAGKTSGFSGGSLFGGGADKNTIFAQTTPSIFGNASSTLAKSSDSPASNAAVEKPSSIFGGNATIGSAANASTTGASIFGGKPIFGSSTVNLGGNIGKLDGSTNDTTKSIFGSSISNSPQSTAGNSIFGNTSSFSGFGNAAAAGKTSIFSGTANANIATTTASSPLFGNKQPDDQQPIATFADLSNKAGAVDFASLAAAANTTPSSKPSEKPGPGGFIGLTNQNSFSSFLKPSNNNSSINKNNSLNNSNANASESFKSVEDDSANNENYDPHYEPIIELPDEIVVSTGEEEETKLFGERATLYRWDVTNKEWKERGVGEMKILMHPVHHSYRLIMRREQIHKLVLNHAVGAEFTFTNMNNNPKSFVWGTMNYAESSVGASEKLAVRFKKVEIAKQFSDKLKECVEAAISRSAASQD